MIGRVPRGMTLLEVIVALTVAGIALAAGASVLGFLTDQQDRSRATAIGTAVAAREALRDWLSSAELGTSGTMRFAGVQLARAPGDGAVTEMEFVTTAPTPVAGGGDARTRVHLVVLPAADSGGPRLVAELTPLPAGERLVLPVANNVTSFTARYLSSVFGPPRWLDSWVSRSVLPAVVELRIASAPARVTPGESLINVPLVVLVGERR